MNPLRTFVETGEKRIFAGAVDWPGWCRSAKDEKTALQGLLDYTPRYARVVQSQGIAFPPPANGSELVVVERHPGNATTDFGAPAVALDADKEPLEPTELERLQTILRACWQAFDLAAQEATGHELQKGRRGGGRELAAIVEHVTGAEQAYLPRLGWKYMPQAGAPDELTRTRQAINQALEAAARGGLPQQGPRGGTLWPVRYFIRRVAWHALDHAWEIEDRMA